MKFMANSYLLISTVFTILIKLNMVCGSDHCNDMKRTLIMDSCEALSKYHRQMGISSYDTETAAPIVKRENEVGPHYSVEFLPEVEDYSVAPNGYQMVRVWQAGFPKGTTLVMSKENAKKLREFDSDYKSRPLRHRTYYQSEDGRLVRTHPHRETRNTRDVKRDIHNKIGVCCGSDLHCMTILCFARG